MAVTQFGTSNALTNKAWALNTEAEVLKKTSFSGLMGPTSEYAIQVRDELAKKAGDVTTFGLRMQETGPPRVNDEPLEGNERANVYYNDTISIGLARDAVAFDTIMSDQRTNFDLREEAKASLSDHAANVVDTSFFNQICANTAETSLGLTGLNSVAAFSSAYKINSGAKANDENLISSDTFTLALVDKAIERAKTATPAIRPAYIPQLGRSLYLCAIHPFQTTQLRNSSSDWRTIWDNAMQGGKIEGNPVIDGSLGIYNGCLLFESTRIPQGIHSGTGAYFTTVRRAVFFGAQACWMGWGRIGGNPTRLRWVESMRDYEKIAGVSYSMVLGMKRPAFNSSDVNSIILSTYAVAAT